MKCKLPIVLFKQMNEQLRQEAASALISDQRSRVLFASNPCPMWIFDCTTFAITDANDAAQRQYGYGREEFVQLTALDLRPPEERERLIALIRNHDQGYEFSGASGDTGARMAVTFGLKFRHFASYTKEPNVSW